MKIQNLYLLLMCSLFLSLNSCKKLKGTISISGKIVDAYDGKGIENIKVSIGKGFKTFGKGGTSIVTSNFTNNLGEFNIISTNNEKGKYHIIFLYYNYPKYDLRNRYRFVDYSYELDDNEYYKGLTKNSSTDIKIELQRVGHLKLNLLKNQTIAVDSIKFGSKLYYINSDTTLFFITEPNKLNQLECSRLISPAYNLLWKDSIQVGLKGDTISKTIQL